MRLPSPFWSALVATLLLLVVLAGVQWGVSMLALGDRLDWSFIARAEALFFVTSLLYLPVLWWLRRRLPPVRTGWAAHAALVAGTLALFVAVQTRCSLPLQRLLLDPTIEYRGSLLAKGIGSFLTLASTVVVATLVELSRRFRAREAQALRLEARLAEARLQALSLQLHPHFLFNTLNTISVLVHRDPAAADTMLTRLADLLRATLRRPSPNEVPLRDEMALLGRYVDIMRIRYGPRLTVTDAVPATLGQYLVPPFVLQPLVENALEHGIARRAGPGQVTIAAILEHGRLRLTVTDDGPGPVTPMPPTHDGDSGSDSGIGLSTTRRRLAQLYGGAQRLDLEPAPGGGTRAVVELPARA